MATPAETAAHRPGWRLPLAAAVVVMLVAAVPFLPALRAGFSDFDDQGFLIEVDGWRGLGPANLSWMFTTFHRGHYQPLTYLSYAIDHTFFGLEPAAYHATNIVLHAAGAMLLFFLTLRVLTFEGARGWAAGLTNAQRCLIAALTATLWAVHPLRVESVAWITERRDVLSCALLLGAALAYLRHGSGEERPGRGRWWWACLGLLGLSLLAKAWGMTFFAVALLMDVRPLRRLTGPPGSWVNDPARRAVLLEKFPLLAMGLASAALAAGAQSEGAARSLRDWGLVQRIAQSAYGLCFYIERTLVPRGFAPLHEVPGALRIADPRWLIPLLITVAAAALIILLRRRWAGLAVAAACYAVLVSPVLGLFQSGMQLVADRYAHIPTIPLFIAGGCGAAALAARLNRRAAGPTRFPVGVAAVALLAAAIVAPLAAMTWRQSTLWQDDARLWQVSIDRGVDGPLVRNYFAAHLEGRGRLAEAEAQYRESLRLEPSLSDSWFGLGSVLNKQGRFLEAEAAFKQAAAVTPHPTKALQMLGVLYIQHLNRPADALATFRSAVEVTRKRGNPERTGRPYLLLAAALGQTGDEAAAVPLLKEAARYEDSRAEAEGHLRDLGLLR